MKRRLLHVVALIMGLFCVLPASAQQDEKPCITIHTDAYDIVGPSNAFHIVLGTYQTDYYDIDCGWGLNEYEVFPMQVDSSTSDLGGTFIPITVSEEGLIRIYGDPANISCIDLEGGHVTKIEMDECVNLEILNLAHNDLAQLDLTGFEMLYAIYLTDNTFTPETPLVIGGPKPYLTILEIDIIDYMDQEFNFSDYPSLVAVDAYHNRALKKCDVSGCPNLMSLSLEMTDVEELDLSKNPLLFHLNISESRISSIDLSPLPKLQRFLSEHVSGWINTDVKLTSIDLTHNPELFYLRLAGNALTSVDLSHNPKLTNVGLDNNYLTALDVTANRDIYSLWVKDNCMDFATLPAPEATWGEYFYNQRPLPVAKSMKEGTALDLSSRVLRPGTRTIAWVMRQKYDAQPEELDPSLYSYADGKITFPTAIPDSVYVVYANDLFTEYTLQTSPFMVKTEAEYGQPSKIASWTVKTGHSGSVSFKVGMSGASPESPKTFYVDLGDGVLKPFTTTSALGLAEANVNAEISKGSKKMALYIPEDETLTLLSLDGIQLTAIDLTAATELIDLSLDDCNLSSVDLQYNRCLQTLDLSNNRLSKLDLNGVFGNYEKYALKSVKAANNNISSFVNNAATAQIQYIDLSGNRLTLFDDMNYDGLLKLNLANNRLSEAFKISYPEGLTELDLSGNNITEMQYYGLLELESLDISDNCFSFATLPLEWLSLGDGFSYGPQKNLPILTAGPGINLAAQDIEVDGSHTEFLWKRTDGTPLVEGTEVTGSAGVFKFPDPSVGQIYCEIGNPGLPQLYGQNAIKTTNFTVKPAPTTIVATFTTAENQEDGEIIFAANNTNELYIDWHGDGVEYLPYPVTETYTDYIEQTTYAGANVKVYTYGDPKDVTVFSIYDIKLSDCDYSRLSGAVCLAVGDAGLQDGKLVLPEKSEVLTQLTLGGNNFTALPEASRFPNLQMLSMNHLNIPALDLSAYKALQVFAGSYSSIADIKFGNPQLWFADLSGNNLETIDLNGLPSLNQIGLMSNKLSTIDLSPVKATIQSLSLVGNRFTFATLPLQSDYPNLTVYYYGNQAPIEVTPQDGVVDLSSQYDVNGVPSEFYWFFDAIIEDPLSGEVSGEQLIEGEEFTMDKGVTTFLESFLGQNRVMAVIYNSEFPNAYLKTNLFNVVAASLAEVDAADNAPVDVYNIQGACVRRGVAPGDALKGLQPGVYIVNGKKYAVTK